LSGVDVVAPVELVLTDDVVPVELDEGIQLGHHPREGDVGDLSVIVTATNIGVDAWEPDLFEILRLHTSPLRRDNKKRKRVEGEVVGLPFWIHEASPITMGRRDRGAHPSPRLGTRSRRDRRRRRCRMNILSCLWETRGFRARGCVEYRVILRIIQRCS